MTSKNMNLTLAAEALALLILARRLRFPFLALLAQPALAVNFIHYWLSGARNPETWPAYLGGLTTALVYFVKGRLEETWAPSSSMSLDTRQIQSAKPTPAGGADGALAPGRVLQDRYEIMGILGLGGMSAVYQARDRRFPGVMKLCAVKEMKSHSLDPQMRQIAIQNFEREANILATLSHPAIPKVYDYFSEEARSYLVMEFIEGRDLEAVLNEMTGFLPQEQVLEWSIQLCDVLQFLHDHNPAIILRDMKPSNIMLDRHGRLRLIDFGIAKNFQPGQKGTMIGTEGYSPPEQYRGTADQRTDIYALGATMHHVLTRQDPRVEPPFSFHERHDSRRQSGHLQRICAGDNARAGV